MEEEDLSFLLEMTEEEYKQHLNLVSGSKLAIIDLQWIETLDLGIGYVLAELERQTILTQPAAWDSISSNLILYRDFDRSDIIFRFATASRAAYELISSGDMAPEFLDDAAEFPFKIGNIRQYILVNGYNDTTALALTGIINSSRTSEPLELPPVIDAINFEIKRIAFIKMTSDPEYRGSIGELGWTDVSTSKIETIYRYPVLPEENLS